MKSSRRPDDLQQRPPSVLVDGIATVNGDFELFYTDESSVRRGLARLAYAYGWAIVREEVVIPGWGRVDLLLQETSENEPPYLIEIKLELNRPSLVRRAFQQADGYGRWWERTYGGGSYPCLVAVTADWAATRSVGDAYPEVQFRAVNAMVRMLCALGPQAGKRRELARVRLAQAEANVDLHRAALNIVGAAAHSQARMPRAVDS